MKFLLLLLCCCVLFSCENNVTQEEDNILYVPLEFNSIQSAIDYANDGFTIIVDNGRYFENIDFCGKKIQLVSLHHLSDDDSDIENTIIDGNNSGRCVRFARGEDSMTLFSGFTSTNGFSSAGGGIICQNYSSPTLSNLKIVNNDAALSGGGILCFNNSNPIINNTSIEHNTVESGTGGGIGIYSSSPIMDNVYIGFNMAVNGGGIYISESEIDMQHTEIYKNLAESGAGFFCNLSMVDCTNSIIYNNTADYGGAGYLVYSSELNLENTTIASNRGKSASAGFYCRLDSKINISNSILWDNLPSGIYFSSIDAPNQITIDYSNVQNGEDGIYLNGNGELFWNVGNIDSNPNFMDSEANNYRLITNSPCIDAGNPDVVYNDNDGSLNDMGAYGGSGSDW